MNAQSGKLVLIGCGPGAVDLLTFRAAQRIGAADVVLRDRLVPDQVVALAGPGASVIDVGKAPGDGGVQQEGINDLILDALRRGLTVARLKSGDPLVFGRAAEEIAVAVEAGAEIEIVPGVTAALAAAADASVLVTERAEIRSFTVVTARHADDDGADWVPLFRPGVCLAFYMGVAQAWRIQSTLMAAGAPGGAPAEWVENAGRPDVRRVSTRLDRIALDAKEAAVRNPAILFLRWPMSLAVTAAKAAAV
jgi:uroporphyrin-III C-methyltransferase